MDTGRSRGRGGLLRNRNETEFVGNLAHSATAAHILKLFSPFGEVAAAHVFTVGKKMFRAL
jgi:hypothetical protein